jgi:hypothetical protein
MGAASRADIACGAEKRKSLHRASLGKRLIL